MSTRRPTPHAPASTACSHRTPAPQRLRAAQAALRRFRIAIIDSVMVATSRRAATPELSRETQGVLSVIAASYEDLLGDENAISAECHFGLALWGVQEGLRATEDTREAVEANMRRCLHVLARCMPAGKDHMLVQRLLRVYENVVGPYELLEGEAGQAHTHAHGHGHAHSHGEGCGHTHEHGHGEECGHTHEHGHGYSHGEGCDHTREHGHGGGSGRTGGAHTHEGDDTGAGGGGRDPAV